MTVLRGPQERAQSLPIITLNVNALPARIDPQEAEIRRRPTATALRLIEASVSPEHAPRLRWRASGARRLARRPAAPRCDAGRLPRRAARRRPRLDGGGCGVFPREAGRAAHSRRRADGPGARRVPANRRRARPFGVSDLAAVLATCHRPRRRGRGSCLNAAPSRSTLPVGRVSSRASVRRYSAGGTPSRRFRSRMHIWKSSPGLWH